MKEKIMSIPGLLLTSLLALMVLTVLLMHFIPRINFRDMPSGLAQGGLDASKPNWVSSHVAQQDSHYIAPLNISTLAVLKDCVMMQSPKTTLVKLDDATLIVYRQSAFFNFTDWLMIQNDGQVTSSATMGYYDFGKNREWVERIRTQCTVPRMANDNSMLFS